MEGFNFLVIGGGMASGHATKVFDKRGIKPGDLSIIPADGVLKNKSGKAISRLRKPEDIEGLLKVIQGNKGGGKAIICRGGYIGVELATKLKNNKYDVTIICPESYCVHSSFTTELAEHVELFCQLKGITILKGVEIASFQSKKNEVIEKVKLVDGQVLDADIVFMGLCSRQIESLKSIEVTPGGLKMDSFFRTSASNLYLLGDVILDKFEDFIDDTAGKKNPQVPKSSVTDDSETVIISLDKDKFLTLVQARTRNLAIITGIDKRLNPDVFVDYITDICALTPNKELGPVSVFITPENGESDILRRFRNSACSAAPLFNYNDFCFCDVVVSGISSLETNLASVDDSLLGSIWLVVILLEDSAVMPRNVLNFLRRRHVAQIIFVTPDHSKFLEEVVARSNRDWEFHLPSLWTDENAIENEDSGKGEKGNHDSENS